MNEVCDLEVNSDETLNVNSHFLSIVSWENATICWKVRNFIASEANVFKIFKIPIRPHIEYCTQAWVPVTRLRNWSLMLTWRAYKEEWKNNKRSKRLQLQGDTGEIRINYFEYKNSEQLSNWDFWSIF